MTLRQIKESDKIYLTAADIADIVESDASSIRRQTPRNDLKRLWTNSSSAKSKNGVDLIILQSTAKKWKVVLMGTFWKGYFFGFVFSTIIIFIIKLLIAS